MYKSRQMTTPNRLINKNGTCDLTGYWRLSRTGGSCLDKFITYSGETAIQAQWRWSLLAMATAFPLFWFLFASIYYSFAKLHGDLTRNIGNTSMQCVANVHSLLSAFLFSMETQERVGYGFRYIREDCPGVVGLFSIQPLIGKIIVGLATSCIFIRFLRPHHRGKHLIFSKTAIITRREYSKYPIFAFRLGDTDNRQLYNLMYRLYYVDKNKWPECMVAMDVEENGDLFMLPTIVRHEINQLSPLFGLKLENNVISKSNFEIIAVVEGTVETTGLTVQARNSYCTEEIQWGYDFGPVILLERNGEEKTIRVNYEHFDKTSKLPNFSE